MTKWFQISQRQRVSPFPNYFSMESVTKEMKGVIGYCYHNVLLIFQNNTFWVFFDKKEHDNLGGKVLKVILKEPELFKNLISKEKKFARTFLGFIKQYRRQASQLSNVKLPAIHQRYEREYKRIYAHYFVILAVENFLMNYLKNYLEKTADGSRQSVDYLNTLISDRRAFVLAKERLAALKLAVRIKSRNTWLEYFKTGNAGRIEEKVKNDPGLCKLFKRHENNYFWITRDYDDSVLTFSDFIKRAKKLINQNPVAEIEKITKESIALNKKQRQIEKEIQLDRYHQKLFQTMRDGMYLKELRKMIVSQSLYYYDPILIEIGKRGGLSLNQVRHLLTSEIKELLLKNKDYAAAANERIKLSVYWAKNGSTKVLVKKKALLLCRQLLPSPSVAKEIQGFPASPGVALGKVRIVMHPWECAKLKAGEILVTVQAVPSFSSAIQRAAALVADGGTGITSHPATLAREAGIPCVTGAKVATKLLKNGDLIEVNGGQGTVKIIKK